MIAYFDPLMWMRWGGQFVYFWAVSIPWKQFRTGVPAVLLASGLLLLSYFAYSDGGSWRRNLLKDQLSDAIAAENFETTNLLLRRQIEAGDRSATTLYLLAENRFNLGQTQAGSELMRELVVTRRNDDAALWLIQKEYQNKSWTDLDEDQRSDFGRLLTLVSRERPKNMGIKELFGDYLIASERYAEAIPYVRELVQYQPMRGLQAAALARRIGDTAMADRLATATLENVSQAYREEPSNPTVVMAVVQNQVFLGQHAEAVQTLFDAIGRMKTDEHRLGLHQAMGETIVDWIAKIELQPNDTPVARLQILQKLQVALQYAPNNPRVMTLVADQVLKTLDSSNEKLKTVRNALVRGSSPGIAHFVQGTASLMRGDAEAGERHLTLASKHLPNSSAILNNLAVALSQREDGDLEQALILSEQAIASMPDPGPYFYETRGQILFQMERYLDAIPDLERALAAEPLAAVAHATLAKCYEQLDAPELAGDHRAAAEAFAKKAVE